MSSLHRLLLSALMLLAALMPSREAGARESLAWMEAVAPPFFIHEGPLKGQGYEDLLTEILKAHLPEYSHSHMQANISRHYQQWKQGEKVCSVGMYKTPERLEFTYYSIPSVFTLPPVLIIMKDRFQAFGGKKTVNLAQLLKEGKFIIGRSPNRSYGVEFDNALKAHSTEKNTYSYESPELSLNLFKMLQAGRIDTLPGLPEEAMYLAETMGIRDQIMTLSVEENQANPEASLSYVACSKNEWGKEVIERINRVLLAQRPTALYRAAYERWLDSSSIEGYRKLYDEVFLKITQ
jgi:uncharacterized protein (TIGR02285 family)